MTFYPKPNLTGDPNRSIILPGDYYYDLTLATSVPFDWQVTAAQDSSGYAFVADADSGLMRTVTGWELEDYLYGGEYEERLISIGESIDEWD
ncbi:MAG: hypothetical protein QNJ36_03215 [Calothrix sp. MO_167.B42]|nr:hypothetical protein [Calothrix sp. MO_167.B42]